MEVWDLYNEKRELTGRDHIRGQEIPQDFYHLVVHVWIRRSTGEYLISQRSADRPTFPLMWECVGGSVLKGEDSLTGALREAKEEIGIDLVPDSGRVLFTRTRKEHRDIMDVWLFEYDGPVLLEKAESGEVAQAEFLTEGQVRELFEAGKMVHTLDYFFAEVANA